MTSKDKTEETEDKQLEETDKPWLFKKGQSGNPLGRPKGSISPIGAVKKIFEENPAEFAAFLEEYVKNPNNAKHIVEMIDGKPKGDMGVNIGEVDKLVIVVKEGE